MKRKRRQGFHQRILDLIKQGEEVHSGAIGRWGQVTGGVMDSNYPVAVRIKSLRGGIECITSFEVGDPVDLIREDGEWWIMNKWEEETQ
ncbi:hypothetical protein GCM10007416_31410 [Kroppenstedtia guangzhouensis]|uniref:Uncharacterized protein n=1 Tax=Kroppenstedtia guangzhouensis TaxID=1274356 RepID=A0ABQ1H3T3_9BACL|nr:hypothetical protein [Kroppenstedtia guangzhouensis]GGA55941.1 hypothetical protein GCM10007416_31410 [Kroppenstedtia guangzhouensis]